jgi:SAM-dependent methyltransferase
MVATKVVIGAEMLCEAADLQAGWRVLDVATGSGNAALAAARRSCDVVGVDFVPALLERGRLRAEVERLKVDFREADAENLPFPDASFDAVLSIYGVMFAPDHRKAASELARVCKPGGKIALGCWTPVGFAGEMFKLVSTFVPPPPGLTPPVRWGEQEYLKSIFGDSIKSITCNVRTAVFRAASPEENVKVFRTYFGPTIKAFEAVGPAREQELAKAMADLARKWDRNGGKGGPIAVTSDYLETVIVRK